MFNWIKKGIIVLFIGGGALGAVDVAIQTKTEVTDLIAIGQEKCLQETGQYCQFLKGGFRPNDQIKEWNNAMGTKIRNYDDIIIHTRNGPEGHSYEIKYYTPPLIEVWVASST